MNNNPKSAPKQNTTGQKPGQQTRQPVAQKPANKPKQPLKQQQAASSKKTPAKQKVNAALLQEQLKSAKADASGLRFEQTAANFFRSKGWNPQLRVEMLGYEFDLFAQLENGWQKKYLVVECKRGRFVSAEDVVHFMYKVALLSEKLFTPNSYNKPELYAYICHTGEVDVEAQFIASRQVPPVLMLKLE